jgi:hypothetical protein
MAATRGRSARGAALGALDHSTVLEEAMKDAYGDGNAIRGIVLGGLLFYGFLLWIYIAYRVISFFTR